MASGGDHNDDPPMEEGAVSLDIDDVHMLLQVEQEQIQKRTFTNWINAQLSKRTPPSVVLDLFTDLQDGTRLLDLLEVMSGQRMKRERGHGVFQHRGNIETALNFLKSKSVKLVNINIPDLTEGRPSIVLGLIWTIILHCHIEELANTLSYSSRQSSLESLASLDSLPSSAGSSPVPGGSPVPRGRSSPLHARFRLSAKKALLLWVRDQCHKVGCSISVKDFKSSWRSGMAFLAILCSLRPDLVDLRGAQGRSSLQNLEEAFRLAEQELHIPRLLEPEDIDVSEPDEKSIMTYVAQFLQYSNDMPSPDDDLQASPCQKAREMASWLQKSYQELEELWSSTEGSGYAERYHAFQAFVSSFYEQRRPVIPVLSAVKRSPKPSREQVALRQAWSSMEQKLQQYNTELDVCLPAPLDTLGQWLQQVEAVLAEDGGVAKDHAHAAREAREKQDQLKVLVQDMGRHLNTLHVFSNPNPCEATWVPPDKLDELKRRFTGARVTAKYYGIKLEYREQRHMVYELLAKLNARLKAWKGPYSSPDSVRSLLQDWHETVDKQCLVSMLKAALHKLKQTASTYTSKAALADDAQMVSRQVQEVEAEMASSSEGVTVARGIMGRVLASWESYRDCLHSMQAWLGQQAEVVDSTGKEDILREWINRHAQLNEVGNFLIESTEGSTRYALAEELSRVNLQWADFVKRTKFAVAPVTPPVPACAHAAQNLVEEAGWLAREPVEVSSGALRTYRKRLQVMIKKITEVDLDVLAASSDCSAETLENLKQTLPKLRESLGRVQGACEGVQRGASLLEGRLAELDHWDTEVSEGLDTLRDWQRRGHPGLRPRVTALVSRGLQLEGQLVCEEQELQACLASVQQGSNLPYLSISALQDRVRQALAQSKESVEVLSRLDGKREGRAIKGQPPPKVLIQAQSQPDLPYGTLAARSPNSQLLQAQSLPLFPVEEEQETPWGEDWTGPLDVQGDASQSRVPSQLATGGRQTGPAQVRVDDRAKVQSQGLVASDPQRPLSSPAGVRAPQGPPGPQPRTPPQTPSPRTKTRAPRTRFRQTGSGSGSGEAEGAPKPPAQDEVYLKARALARSRLDGAKHRLQLHIQEAIAVFSNRTLFEEQAEKKENTLKTLNPSVLEEFMGSVEGMGPFCSEAQLREMKLQALSIRGQWEGVCLAIASFLPHLRCELERGLSVRPAVWRHVSHTKSQGSSSGLQSVCSEQECVGAVDSEGRLKALRGLQDTLTPPEPLVRATTCVKETEGRLEVARHHDGGTSRETAPPSDGGVVTEGSTPAGEAGLPADLTANPAHSQGVTGPFRRMETLQVCRRSAADSPTVAKQEEGSSTQEVQMQYRTAHSAFHLQLQKNSQRLTAEVTPDSASLQVLRTLLQELQALRQETEALWFEFELQFSQCDPQLEEMGEGGQGPERVELIQQWRTQQIWLQARMKTLQTAMTLIEPADLQITFISNRLDLITQNPLNITEFTLNDSGTLHEDLKLLDDNIQTELDRLAGFEQSDSTPADLNTEPTLQPVRSAVQQVVQSCRDHLDQQRKRLRRTDSGLAELEGFLGPLQQAGSELSHLFLSASSSFSRQKGGSRLTPIQRRVQEATAQAPRIDALLGDAGLRITLDGAPASCLEVAGALGRRVDEARGRERRGAGQREERRDGEKEQELSHRRRTLLATLKEVKGGAEKLGLKEPTLPALQQRLRTFTDMESKLAALQTELRCLQEASAQTTSQDPSELQTQWEQTQVAVRERREQCQSVMEMLKKFQGCRSRLGLVLQQAEQTIGEQASYMGKDNLHRLLNTVTGTKAELSVLGDGVEEIRGVCRQLQHQLRGIPDCVDAPFENEADAIMDRWLDVTERTECYLDNLRVGLALWEKLLTLAGEVEGWTSRKLASFSQQAQPFQSQHELLGMQEEIKSQEECVEHFHKRSCEIQGLLQSQEPPLELQVIESQLRKRMEQVKDLFCESTDIFKELAAAKGQVSAKMADCQLALQGIHDTLRRLGDTEGQHLLKKIQVLSGELDAQAQQVDSLQQQLGFMSGVISAQSVQTLAADITWLQRSVREARELLAQKKEKAEGTHRLHEEQRELQEWLQSTERCAETQEGLGGLQVELARQSARVETLRALVAPAQGESADSPSLLEDCRKLLERYDRLQARLQSSPSAAQEQPLGEKRDLRNLAGETQAWIREVQQQVEALGTLDSQAQTEERLKQAKAVLALRQEGDSRLEELRALAQGLAQQEGLDEGQSRDIQRLVQDTQTQWVTLQQDTEQLSRRLQGVVERASSCLLQRQQACLRLEELQTQAAALPRLFPWPGVAERQQAVERARSLLERTKVLGPALSALRAQRKELLSLTQDPSWTEPSWAALEDGAPGLIRELNELCAGLVNSIQKEQCCLDLLRQCREDLASLQKTVEETRRQATDAQSHGTDARGRSVLQQAAGRTDRDLQEAHSLSASLTGSLSAEGRAALTAELRSLQDSRDTLGKTAQDVLVVKGQQQQEQQGDGGEDRRFIEQTCSLQGELQGLRAALEQELKAGEQHDGVRELQKHWVNLKALESQQQDFASHLQELRAPVGSEKEERISPEEVAAALGTLTKQSVSLSMSLSETLRVCKERTALSVRESIHALRMWNHRQSQHRPKTVQSMEMALEEGEVLRQTLQGALSQTDFLHSSVGQELMQSLEREGTDTLTDSTTLLAGLSQSLQLAKNPVEAAHTTTIQVTAGESTTKENLSTNTPPKLSGQLTPEQKSIGVKSTPAKAMDSDAQHIDGTCDVNPTLRSNCMSKITVGPGGHLEEFSSISPKPVFTIVLDTDLSGHCPSLPDRNRPVSESQDYILIHSDAMTTQCSEGMCVAENSAKPQEAPAEHLLEFIAEEQPAMNQEEEPPSFKKVATIILDAAVSQNTASTEGLVKQSRQTKQPDCTSSHDWLSNDELQTTKCDHGILAPGSQESGWDEKANEKCESLQGKCSKPKTKKVVTIILEADVPMNESMDSQMREPAEKASSEILICSSENSSKIQQQHPDTSGHCEHMYRPAMYSDGYGPFQFSHSEVDNAERKSSQDTHPSNVELDSFNQKPPDGVQSADLLTSLEAAHRGDSTDPTLKVAINLTVGTHKHQGEGVDNVTSESAIVEDTGTRESKPDASNQGVSMEVNVACVSVGHGPDAMATSHAKDEADIQTHCTELTQMDSSQKDKPDSKREIHTQGPEAISAVPSNTDEHSPEDKDFNLPEIIFVPKQQDKIRATEERRAPEKDLVAGVETAGQSPKLPQELEHGATLLDILAGVEPLVEAHNPVGNEAVEALPSLQPTVAEPEAQLSRTVHRVLSCRYRPAQLNPQVMAQQLQEAETCRQCVLQQVATLSRKNAERGQQSEVLQRMEGRWSAALLDASATVQVKEAQHLQITQYHQQTEALRGTLQRFTTEMETLSLDDLGSSSIQAKKLEAFLKCMDQEKAKIGELLQTCCQVFLHLSEADGPVALLAQVEDLQEGWQILQGTADRTLRHATACTTEVSALLHEAMEVHNKLENIQASMASSESSVPHSDCQRAIQLTVTGSELTTANEQYFTLLGYLEAFNQGFLGKKEKNEIEEALQTLKGQLYCTQEQVYSNNTSVSDPSVASLVKVIQDFLPWAKHVEQQIEARRKVALFPEHAHHQLTEMKRFQSEVTARQTEVMSAVEEQKALLSELNEGDVSVMLSLLEDLEDTYQVISEKITHAIEDVDQALQTREKMWSQIADVSTWLVAHIEKESSKARDSKLKVTIADLKAGLQGHNVTLKEAERQAAIIEALLEQSAVIIPNLTIGESHYLIDRLTILQAEVSRVASCEQAACWELEELLHAQQASAEELAAIQKSLKQISMDLERQRFPVTSASLSAIEPLRHMLVEHQCHVQELQHCQEPQRRGLLQTIHTLQAKARTLNVQAREHEKYLSYRKSMEDSREAVKRRIPLISDRTVDWREKLQVCRTLLTELPLVKQQCQRSADQLEAVSGDVYPSQLTSERQKIHRTVENLATWELAVHNELCSIERKLLEGLSRPADLTAVTNIFHKARQELQQAICLRPNEQAIVGELQKFSTLQRSLESGLRVLEALEHRKGAEEEAVRELSHYGKKISRDCSIRMENLSQAWEALKDYQWAVQGALRFLDDAEPRLLLDLTGTRDCHEELKATQQTVDTLRDSFKAHVDRLGNLAPRQTCFSTVETQQLHIQVLSLLLVREAMLEAQGQLRMETLKRFIEEQSIHKKQHVELSEQFQGFESQVNECLLQKTTSFEECLQQQEKAKALQEEVWCLAGRLEQLRGGCPALSCGVSWELSLALLWRRWARLKRRVGVLRARLVQRDQDWKDAALSMERSSLSLESLSRELPDPTAVRGSLGELQALLTLTELQQECLDHEQQALASSQALLARLLGSPSPRDPEKPVQICQELQNLQSRCRSLRAQCMLVRRTTLTEVQERGRDLEEINAVRQTVLSLLAPLKVHRDAPHTQEAKIELGTQKAKLQVVVEGLKKRYLEVPHELQGPLEEVAHALQEVEEKLAAASQRPGAHHRLSQQVRQVTAALGKVQELLQQSSSSVAEAEGTLKRVWDDLERWHSRLAVLEGEVQEVAMEEPEKAHTLMDELTDPLQLYQLVANQAEHRTAFLSRIPACLQEYEDLLNSATHWQNEAKTWLDTPRMYTSAKCLHGHAMSLQMVLEDSERISTALGAFVPVMQDISPVCDTDFKLECLKKAIQDVTHMQQSIMEPHAQLQHLAEEVDAIEAEVKTMEKNVTKINTILSSMDTDNANGEEHLQYCQVILENIHSMQRTLAEIEHCRLDLGLPSGAEETLTIFQRAQELQQPLQELEQRTHQQSTRLEEGLSLEPSHHRSALTAEGTSPCPLPLSSEGSVGTFFCGATDGGDDEDDDDDDDEGSIHSSSSGTLTGSVVEDPEEMFRDDQGFETTSPTVVMATVTKDSTPKPLHTASVMMASEDIAKEMGSLSLKAPLASAQTHENTRRERTTDVGSDIKAIELISKANGEASTEPESAFKEPGLGSPEPQSVLRDSESAPEDFQSGSKDLGSATTDLPSVINNTEAVTNEPASTAKELASVTNQPDSVPASPVRLTPDNELTTKDKVTEPRIKPPAVGGERQGVPTGSESVMPPTALPSHNGLASSEASESLTEPPETHLPGLTQLDRTGEPGDGASLVSQPRSQHGLKDPVDVHEEVVSADSNMNVNMMTPIQGQASARPQTPAQPIEGAAAKGDLALLLTSLSGKQELENPVFILQKAVAKAADPSNLTADHSSLQYASGRGLSSLIGRAEAAGSDAELQGCAEALLRGLSALLQLGSQRLQRSQDTKLCSRSQLQTLLGRHKKFFQDMERHWGVLQCMSQRLPPGALQSLAELKEQVEMLQRRAVDQGSQMHRNLQEWGQCEEASGRLARLLDELEAGMPSGGPRQEPQGQLQESAAAQQQLRLLLEESRPKLGLVLDQCRALGNRGCSLLGTSNSVRGSGLELRWASVHRRLQMEETHSEQIRKQWDRFQRDSQALEEWLVRAKQQLQAWGCQPDSEPQDLRWVQLTQLMGFSQQAALHCAQWASAHDAGTQLLQLMDSEAPCLRGRLAQLEQGWVDVTSALPTLQSWVKQGLSAMPSCELLSELGAWLSDMERRLEEVQEEVGKSQEPMDAAGHSGQLKCCQDRKAEISSHQLCMDRLNQLVEEAGHVNDEAEREERTHLAEQVGALHLRWVLLQAKADSQTQQVEDLLQVCSQREGRLQHLRRWVSAQKERLSGYEMPDSCFHTEKALQDLEDADEKLKLRCSELQELKAACLSEDKRHPGDQSFSAQVEEVLSDHALITQQVDALRPSLQQVRDQWVGFERELEEAMLLTARTQYSLEQLRTPCLSLQESSDHMDQMQTLQQQAEEGAELWSYVGGALISLSKRMSPGAAHLLTERVEKERARWLATVEAAREECERSRGLLQLWREYGRLTGVCSGRLGQLWERCRGPAQATAEGAPAHGEGDPTGPIQAGLECISDMELGMEDLQICVGDVLEAAKLLIGQIEPQGAALIQSETRLLSRDIVHLGQALFMRREQLQEDLEQYQNFSSSLESLELHLRGFESGLLRPNSNLDSLKRGLLELSGLASDLGALNDLSVSLRLSDTAQGRLRTLNEQWLQVFTEASDRYREMYSTQLSSQSFQQRCEDWLAILEKLESDLATDVCATQPALREQLTRHQKLKVEMCSGQQLLQSVVREALQLLERGPSEDSRLIVRVTERQQRWQEALRLAERHGVLLQRLMGQWRLLSRGQRKLWRLLSDLEPLLPPAGLAPCSLHQLCDSIHDFEWAQKELQAQEGLYAQVLEAGGELVSRLQGQTQTQTQTQTHVQEDLISLRKSWEDTQRLLGVRKALAESVILTWKHCETGLVESAQKLEEIKARLEQPLPENLEDLHKEEKLSKEHQEAVELWGGRLRELATMKADASQYVLAGDTALIQGQLDQLSSHWEELCLKVSLRKQEIADRLHAWVIFNDKNKELCEWLVQMQNKVAHGGEHLSIEEMVDKLKKDCMEEINLFSENKSHLKQLGEQLLSASDKTKEAEIHGALRDVNARWQSLFDHIEARVKKLKETLAAMQQLEKNMSNLRAWLSHVEQQLAQPVLYSACHSQEINRRLSEQQELQRDIEQHTDSVASVLTLCDALLHDEDACESEGGGGGGGGGGGLEGDSIQQTTRSLDQRWRNICAQSLERRLRIEETWRLWCRFMDDYSRFEGWLKEAERAAAEPNSSDVLYADAKEELKRFEGFQREVHERLTQLEVINHQYRQLARENRTDSASQLKAMVRVSNLRWDALQRRMAAILRRLRYFTAQREEFEGTREGLLVWLTELDLQLTNVEHFSESDIHEKLKCLNGFQKEITLNTNRIDALIVFGEALIQRSCPLDAAHIEDELVELHTYCQEVFRRAARFHQRLTSPQPELKEDLEPQQGLVGTLRRQSASSAGEPPAHPPVCLVAPLLERSGRETPVSVDSIPLEWDHTVDVGGSSSHEEDEEGTYYSTLSGPGRSLSEAQSWHSQDSQLDLTDSASHTPTQSSTPYKPGYVRLMTECSGSIENLKRVSLILDEEEQQEEQGLTGLATADMQSGVIERWELLQAQSMSGELCGQRDAQQLTSDLSDITAWLGQVTPELLQLQKPEPDATIPAMEAKVRHLKEIQKTFAHYKAMMLSLNLGGQELQQQKQQQQQQGESPAELQEDPGRLQEALRCMNQGWADACAHLEDWESSLRSTLMRCQEFHETLHALLLWLAHAESRRYAVDIRNESVPLTALQDHKAVLKGLEEELLERQRQVASLQELTAPLLPEVGGDEGTEAREKLHVISNRLRLLLRQVAKDLVAVQKRLDSAESLAQSSQMAKIPGSKESEAGSRRSSTGSREEKRDPSPQRSFFQRVLRAAFPLHLFFLFVLVLACLVPLAEEDFSCTLANNFARSFYPMLRYTNGPPPT